MYFLSFLRIVVTNADFALIDSFIDLIHIILLQFIEKRFEGWWISYSHKLIFRLSLSNSFLLSLLHCMVSRICIYFLGVESLESSKYGSFITNVSSFYNLYLLKFNLWLLFFFFHLNLFRLSITNTKIFFTLIDLHLRFRFFFFQIFYILTTFFTMYWTLGSLILLDFLM